MEYRFVSRDCFAFRSHLWVLGLILAMTEESSSLSFLPASWLGCHCEASLREAVALSLYERPPRCHCWDGCRLSAKKKRQEANLKWRL